MAVILFLLSQIGSLSHAYERQTLQALSSPADRSGPETIVDLTTAIQQALEYHPSIVSALRRRDSSGENVQVAKAQYYPQISGGLSSDYNRYRTGRFEKSYLSSVHINVSQVLYDFGKISGSVRKAEYVERADGVVADLNVEQVARETARALIESVRFDRLTTLAAEQAVQVERLVDLVKQREEKGASTRSDVLQALARLDAINAQRVSLETEREGWLREVLLLLGAETPGISVSIGSVPDNLLRACINRWMWMRRLRFNWHI